ncbi:hypothetical protein G4Y73_12915 [Wenzhouxiangella sp. XN201]|uniref:hypothetical protein n=1 Tax=Wenzhouxiangella sp. XN201 TaxID=2710755 RepID=UPI0013CC4C4F|nr:hypothetical protein [Wenzhouxiangella sp. XN201]NEZ05050.1 hypothetical protein [Wenzhouxiangella sp. XN201]
MAISRPVDPAVIARCPSISTRLLVTLAALLLIAGCGPQPYDPGLLRSPGFGTAEGERRSWTFSHHASTDSYELTIDQGVAAIRRVGPEPWAFLAQMLPEGSIEQLAGRRLVFAVELRGQLDTTEWGKPFEPTGLLAKMWHRPGDGARGAHALLGSERVHSERLPLPGDASLPDWKRHTLEFDTPETLSRLQIAIVMSTGGTLEMRNPSLHIVEPD